MECERSMRHNVSIEGDEHVFVPLPMHYGHMCGVILGKWQPALPVESLLEDRIRTEL